MNYKIHCIKCNNNFIDQADICQHDYYYNYLEVFYDYDQIKSLGAEEKENFLKKILPLENIENFYTLGEGNTPLIPLKYYSSLCQNSQVFVKNESVNPTGSFKDRETAIVISKAKELGYKKIAVVSSGNAALSAAVYANKAKIKCECFIPNHTSKTKKLMLQLLGCKFNFVDGDYESIYRKVSDNLSSDIWNITSGQNFYREEGSKFISYEIWKQLNGSIPDKIIVPIGNGTLFSAIFKGFWEMKQIGLIDRIPHLVGVQIEKASPVKKALEGNKDFVILEKVPDSVAEGIIARESYDSPKVVNIINSGYGEVVEVTEEETILALKKIIETESLVPEPTSAVVYAALDRIESKCGEGLKIVCVQTGNGMKNVEEILSILEI